MSFTSIEFAFFLPIVFGLYWMLRRSRSWQNVLIVAASYIFYGYWNPRFLFLIFITSICSYLSGLMMISSAGEVQSGEENRPLGTTRAKTAMLVNIILNLLILGVFKYYNFFVREAQQLLGLNEGSIPLLQVVLPVGISFYTFQALSYSIDVYRRRIEPTRDIMAFLAYISFFPQLVAGPIERSTNLLPQFLRERNFDYAQATDGMRQMMWGFFKKMIMADLCADYYENAFYVHGGGPSEHLIFAIFFSFQIYGDFSGYSDIAIGTAKLFGIRLKQNFRTPYFSRDMAEFWRRWHISLTTWFRDYVYIPLGGSREGKWKTACNTFVIFFLSGLWHGANWTYIAWGLYHACLFIPLILTGRNRRYTDTVAAGRLLPTWKELLQMTLTFMLSCIGWIIFRSTGMPSCLSYFRAMLTPKALIGFLDIFTHKEMLPIGITIITEWINRDYEHGLQRIPKFGPFWIRCIIYAVAAFCILFFSGSKSQFIYFQF